MISRLGAGKWPRAGARACQRTRGVAARAAGSVQRVLRYPHGEERLIVYPLADEPDEVYEEDPGEACSWHNEFCAWADVAVPSAPAVEPVDEETSQQTDWEDLFQELDSRRSKATDIWELVRGSYEVMTGCPWVATRPLYVVVVQLRGAQTGSLYTLRTRTEAADGWQDELTRVLGGSAPAGLAGRLTVSHLRDGYVAFGAAEDADRFCTELEAELEAEVDYMEMDAHELFRTALGVSGVVVHVPHAAQGGFLPLPYQLQAALQGGSMLDSAAAP